METKTTSDFCCNRDEKKISKTENINFDITLSEYYYFKWICVEKNGYFVWQRKYCRLNVNAFYILRQKIKDLADFFLDGKHTVSITVPFCIGCVKREGNHTFKSHLHNFLKILRLQLCQKTNFYFVMQNCEYITDTKQFKIPKNFHIIFPVCPIKLPPPLNLEQQFLIPMKSRQKDLLSLIPSDLCGLILDYQDYDTFVKVLFPDPTGRSLFVNTSIIRTCYTNIKKIPFPIKMISRNELELTPVGYQVQNYFNTLNLNTNGTDKRFNHFELLHDNYYHRDTVYIMFINTFLRYYGIKHCHIFFPNITDLDISCSNEEIKDLKLFKLKKLKLSNNNNYCDLLDFEITGRTFDFLPETLTELYCDGLRGLYSVHLALLQHTHLKKLTIDNSLIENIPSQNLPPTLEKLICLNCHYLTDTFMIHLYSLPLTELHLIGSTQISGQYFIHLPPTIQFLDFSNCSSFSKVAGLGQLLFLKELILTNTCVTGEDFKFLPDSLKKLMCNECKSLSIQNMTLPLGIEYVDFNNSIRFNLSTVEEDIRESIIPNSLRLLNLKNCNHMTEELLFIGAEDKKFTHLDLSHINELTGICFRNLPTSICELDLTNTKIDDDTLINIYKLNQLDLLNLSNTKITGKKFNSQSENYHLPSSITKLILQHCTNFKNKIALKNISKALPRLKFIDLSKTYVTGKNLSLLSRSLETLICNNCGRHFDYMEDFNDFIHLTKFVVSGTYGKAIPLNPSFLPIALRAQYQINANLVANHGFYLEPSNLDPIQTYHIDFSVLYHHNL